MIKVSVEGRTGRVVWESLSLFRVMIEVYKILNGRGKVD